ncbi:hypothetical protein OEZ86_006997 [Tetradesmus obliquus]|nr:hypothetical protein OEZ86_006997 [Tetradesmus obliquus]
MQLDVSKKGLPTSTSSGHWQIAKLIAAVVALLFIYSLFENTSARTRAGVLLGRASHITASSTNVHTGSIQGGSIAQQLLSDLAKGPSGSLLERHILPLINFNSLSAAQLPLLLQGTNFTTLSTATVLDAAGSRLSSQQKWQLANLHQRLFCAAGLTQDARHLGNAVLDHDIVSGALAGESHSYEKNEVDAVLWAMQQYKHKQQQAGAAAGLMEQPFMVDVGANVGTFLFKGMPSNIAMLRHSLCVNPHLAERVALFGTSLGPASDTCAVISDQNNVGDGHTVCGAKEFKRRTIDTGYTVRHCLRLAACCLVFS